MLRRERAEMTNLDWNDLRHFLAVAHNGSTIAASKALRVSQSTVHRRLSELEKCFGRHLVIRMPTGYRLTEFGNELCPIAQRVEDAVAALQRYAAAADDALVGSLRVTCSESIGYRLIKSQILDAFHAHHPGLNVELIMSDRFLDLSKGEAEIAIRAGEPDDDTLVGRKIADVPWALYSSHSYIKRYGQPERVEDICRHSIIEFDGDIKNHHAARWLRAVAPQARIAGRSNSIPDLLIAVKSSVGIAPLPLPLAARDVELKRVLDTVPGLFSPIYVLTHPDLRRTPRVCAFFDHILAVIEDIRPILAEELRDIRVRR
jgi:DNA-binding transcriptional LysR family regulator